jgi:branched-chain amino acid transport system ATP-binding protein
MTALLKAEGLTKAFGGLVAVSDMSLSVSPGEILGLIGPNGSGKTTLLNLIAGTIRCDAGTIRMDGEDITRLANHRRVRSASIAPSSSCACRRTCRRSSASWRE